MTTIIDIAKRCGVAPSTVSRAINNRAGISDEIREKILEVVKEMGYHPNAPARALVGCRTHTIGILVNRVSEPYYAGIVNGALDTTDALGYYLLIGNTNDENLDKLDPVNKLFTQGRVDGLIIVGGSIYDNEYINKLSGKDLPYVLVERYSSDAKVNCIDVDNASGGYLATNHLIKLGHRRIGYLAGNPNYQQTYDRILGYHRALQEAGISSDQALQAFCYFDEDKAYQGMKQFLALDNPPTAVFAADDSMAFGAIRAVFDSGLRVPEDIAVVGFDDIHQSSWNQPRLTTVHQPTYEMGELAVKTLVKEIEGVLENKVKQIFPLELVIRDSCGAKLGLNKS